MILKKLLKIFPVKSLLVTCILALPFASIVSQGQNQVFAATNGNVSISEISWMGTTYSTSDEWMELVNNTGLTINLTGWTLNSTDLAPSITLSGTVASGGHFLLERTDDTTVPGVVADQIYSGALGNTVEVLELRDASGILIDTVDAWHAGDNTLKATMERIDPTVSGTLSTNWKTSTTVYDGGYGTPATHGGISGGGTFSGDLEIHHINVGQGDATLVVGPTGKSLLIDSGETYWNSSADAVKVGAELDMILGSKHVDYVLITHMHLDHIGYVGYGGLWNLVENQGFTFGHMIHRDFTTYLGTTSTTLDLWKTYLAGEGNLKLNPIIAVEGTSQIDLGVGVSVDIVAVDGNGKLKTGDFSLGTTPPSENDYSIALKLRYGVFDQFIAGDISGQYYESGFSYKYHDIETSVAKEVGDVDVYRANHHGSDHSNNATLVNQLDPEVSIVSVGEDNSYGHPTQTVMDRILATSDVYLTERGDPLTNVGAAVVSGDTLVQTNGITYTINGIVYNATNPVRIDKDGDGYFVEVDPNDADINIIPQPNGGYDSVYQP